MSDDAPIHARLSRRGLLAAGAMTAAATAVSADLVTGIAGAASSRPTTPAAALKTLMDGNARYRNDTWSRRDYSPVGERRATAQEPFAAVLTCADSRISPPLVFDVERGNIFAAHVAGNSVDTGTLGSIEYAVAVLKVRLVMVLGHSDCGAVKAALSVAAGKQSYPPAQYGAIGAVVDQIVPAIEALPTAQRTLSRGIAANARFQAADLAQRDPIIAPAVKRGDLDVVAAVYNIRTGRVSVV